MTGPEIVAKVKELDLPAGSYIVFGSCPMALVGIREAGDIDMLVTKEVLNDLKQAGWQMVDKGDKDKPYAQGDFEAHATWEFSSYAPTLADLLKTATIVNGIPFAALNEVRKWKAASGRPKDLVDVDLIDAYTSQNTN